MKTLKNILMNIIAGFENAFDPHHKKRFILNIVLLATCVFVITSIFMKDNSNQKKLQNTVSENLQVKNQSKVISKTQKTYQENQSIIANNDNKEEVEKATQENQDIYAAQNANYTVSSPGNFQLQKLSCLSDQNMSIQDKRKILDQYCYLQPGETIWLFKNWLPTILGMDKDAFSTGFDINNSILYIHSNLDQDKQDYLKQMINLIWDHSAQKYRSNSLKIEFID